MNPESWLNLRSGHLVEVLVDKLFDPLGRPNVRLIDRHQPFDKAA
jgi:hypothetical protein